MNGTPPSRWSVAAELPSSWLAIGGGDPTQVTAAVDRRLEDDPELAPYAEALRAALGPLAESVGATSGRVMAALRWEQIEQSLVMATAFVHVGRPDDYPIDGSLDRIEQQLAKQLPSDEFAPHIDRVEIGLGPAIRLEAVREPIPVDGDRQPLRLLIEYWAAVPGGEGAVASISFSTASLAFARVLVPEFDSIAESVSVSTVTEPVDE